MTDLIDRSMAIDAILSVDDYGNSDRANALGLAEFKITTLPTAEPKQGEWLEVSVSEIETIEEWQSAKCSYCGLYHTTPYMYYVTHYPYCPSCGAKMGNCKDDG